MSTSCHRLALLFINCAVFTFLALSVGRGQAAKPPADGAAPALADKTSLNFENVPVTSVIDFYEQLSGKHCIRDANLMGVPPVSINGNGLNKEDGLRLIEGTLLLNGVTIIPVDDKTVKVVTVGTNKNPRSEGVRVYTKEADLPAGDGVVTYCLPLAHIDPLEAASVFEQVAPVHVYGSYAAAPSAHAIILTENASVVRELIALAPTIDVISNIPPNPRPAAPETPGTRPPHGHHPFCALLIFLAVAALSFWLGHRMGRKSVVRG